MPATFQKTIDKTLEGISSKFAFLDDILVITKGSLNEHEHKLDKMREKLDKENLALNLQKCDFAKKNSRMARLQNNSQETTPLITKTEAIMNLEHTKTLKHLRSFMGSINNGTIKTTIEKTRQKTTA